MPLLPLTTTEASIAKWLARGKTLPQVANGLAITMGTLRVHLSHIRTKTGIDDLSPFLLSQYLQQSFLADPRELLLPRATEKQLEVLGMLCQGISHKEIAAALNMSIGTAMNHASQGCKRLGITGQGFARATAIRKALGVNGSTRAAVDLMDDPMF